MADDSAQSRPPTTPLPSYPERSVGLNLPVPINARLDQVVRLAEQAGERTSRKEIVAVCILAAPDGADEKVRWLRIYRNPRPLPCRDASTVSLFGGNATF